MNNITKLCYFTNFSKMSFSKFSKYILLKLSIKKCFKLLFNYIEK